MTEAEETLFRVLVDVGLRLELADEDEVDDELAADCLDALARGVDELDPESRAAFAAYVGRRAAAAADPRARAALESMRATLSD